jgi:hypothetical protein
MIFTIRKAYLVLIFSGFSFQLYAQTNLCVGGTAQMAYSGSGGAWISSNTGAATVSASGLVTAIGAGSSTVDYQTSSSSTTSLYWDFESGTSNENFVPTNTSHPSLLSGFFKTTGNRTLENWGTGIGYLSLQRQIPSSYCYIQFTTTGTPTVSTLSFTKWHNHGIAGNYNIDLQISISDGAWTTVGTALSCNSGTTGTSNTVTINTAVPAGTHKIRWIRLSGSNGGDFFALNNVTLTCSSISANTLNTNTINVSAASVSGTVSSNQTICSGVQPANVTLSGSSGTIQWQVSTDNSSFTNISGATAATLTSAQIGTITSIRYYRAVVTSGACTAVNSPVHTITVSNPVLSESPVSTDLVWNGKESTDWSNVNNWLSFNGTNFNLATSIPSNITNVFIQAASSCVLNQPKIVSEAGLSKNMTIETAAVLTINSGSLSIKGNWIKNGSFIPGTGSVTFNGTAAQSISGIGTTSFTNLIVNNSSTGLSLLSPIDVTGSLTMTSGNISSSSLNIISLGVGSAGTLNWTAGTIVGPFKRWYSATTNSGNSSGLFPVGTATNNRWALLEYPTAPTTAGYLSAEFKAVNPTITSAASNGLPLLDQSNWQVENIASDGYWEFIPTIIDGGNYNLTVRPKAFSGIGSTYDGCRIIKSPNNHAAWTLDGVHGSSVGNQGDFTVSRTGMSGFSYFAIGSQNLSALPIELISLQTKCSNDNTTIISWSTASEHNSSHFLLESSGDSFNWSNLEIIPAAGNSTSLLNYFVLDNRNLSYPIYYQLTQFDSDGKYITYPIITNSCLSINPNEIDIYPNPNTGVFYITIRSFLKLENAELKIFDIQGSEILNQKIDINSGTTNYYFEDFPQKYGMYILKVTHEYKNYPVKKMLVN